MNFVYFVVISWFALYIDLAAQLGDSLVNQLVVALQVAVVVVAN